MLTSGRFALYFKKSIVCSCAFTNGTVLEHGLASRSPALSVHTAFARNACAEFSLWLLKLNDQLWDKIVLVHMPS